MDERNEDTGEAPEVPSNLINIEPEPEIKSTVSKDVLHGDERRHSGFIPGPNARERGHKKPLLDWTSYDIPNATPFVSFLRNFAWEKTTLGPMSGWPLSLRSHFQSIISHQSPRGLYWGPEHILLYNEACISLVGDKHPIAMGRPVTDFKGYAEEAGPAIAKCYQEGTSLSVANAPIRLDRYRELPNEETYWSFELTPVMGEEEAPVAVQASLIETTAIVVGERRMNTVLDIGRETLNFVDLNKVWTGMITAMDRNTEDIPYALLYAVHHKDENGKVQEASPTREHDRTTVCDLVGLVGFDKKDKTVPKSFAMQEDDDDVHHGLADIFIELERSRDKQLLTRSKGTLPDWLHRGFEDRGGGAPCTRAIAMPIPPVSGSGLLGFLILGVTTRRPYDDDYKLFLRLLSDRLLSSTAQLSLPKEQKDAQIAAEEAALRHAALSRQLALKSQEAERNEAKVSRMAQQAPVGMILLDDDMNPVDFNEEYYRLTGVAEDSRDPLTEMVLPEDKPKIVDALEECRRTRSTITLQYRLKSPWNSYDAKTGIEMHGYTWLNVLLFPEVEDDEVTGLAGWVTDISLQKWTELEQSRRLEEALELKRQRENFIDMTSHEMRNPLSAILQSADGVIACIQDARKYSDGDIHLPAAAVEAILEAVDTINLCGQHQRRIVDDILTMSKLDSNMMMLAPDRVQPRELLGRALKMFEGEIESAEVDVAIVVDKSYEAMNIEEVVLDPSRLLQVLINLLTNAIKFTKTEEDRRIRICLSASSERPDYDEHHQIKYIPRRDAREEVARDPLIRRTSATSEQWTNGQAVYLQFAVEDSGRGMNEEELNVLFMRFSQASAKTYSQYGGSGLGLFISRELTELQGGQIGVSSQVGKGSVFAFYVKALQVHADNSRRTSAASSVASAAHSVEDAINATKPQRMTAKRTSTAVTEDEQTSKEDPGRKRNKNLNILIVEDNIINQKVIATQLRRLGNIVHVADNGLEALHFLQRTTFTDGRPRDPSLPPSPTSQDAVAITPGAEALIPLDLVLLDQEMPIMDGLTAIRRIRDMERQGYLAGHVPVIAVTANARDQQVKEAMDSGMDGVVTKPFRIPDLLAQMDELLRDLRHSEI